MAELKDRLQELINSKQELDAEKAKLTYKLEELEKQMKDLEVEIELVFGTTNVSELAEIRQKLINEAEELLNESETDE